MFAVALGACLLLISVGARGNELVGAWELERAEGARADQVPASFIYKFDPNGTCVLSFVDKKGSLNESVWSYEIQGNRVRLKLLNSKKLAEVFQFSIVGDVLTMQHRDKNQPTLVFRRPRA